MNHAVVLPVLLPLAGSVGVLLLGARRLAWARALTLLTCVGLLALAAWLLALVVDGTVHVYALGGWPAPFGIVLVLDRLSALMLALTAALALPACAFALRRDDRAGRHFHVLFLLELTGLNGAFLSGDLFNLFVFFEMLLLASYGLLAHGGGSARSRAGFCYAVINLAGSSLFLLALALLYGTLGTLNLADVATRLAAVPDADQALVRAALALLLVVFVLKAALVPLALWLPHAYNAACAPAAALFAILTKVGVYAVLRVAVIALDGAALGADLLAPWLAPLALLTIVAGTLGTLAAAHLRMIVAHLVLISTGTLLLAVAAGTPAASAAALFYLVHTTLVTAGLFLLGEHVSRARGRRGDSLQKGAPSAHGTALALGFLVLALAVSGMPPLAGFVGKLMLLRALHAQPGAASAWAVLLLSGFVVVLVLARAASALFWEGGRPAAATGGPLRARQAYGALPVLALIAASPLLTVGARPLADYAAAAAAQLHARTPYVTAVLGDGVKHARQRRP